MGNRFSWARTSQRVELLEWQALRLVSVGRLTDDFKAVRTDRPGRTSPSARLASLRLWTGPAVASGRALPKRRIPYL